MKRIDLRLVGVTDHARNRWAERVGRPDWELRFSLLASRPAHRRLRRRIREAYQGGRWPGLTRVYVDRGCGAVFVLGHDPTRSSGHARVWNVVTVLPLWACRAGGDVVEVREEESCAAA